MTAETIDYYDALGVSETASPAQLKAAYLRLVREHTPESSPERFRLVSEAYRVLSNPEKRRQYDRQGRLPADIRDRLSALMTRAVGGDDNEALDNLEELCEEYPESQVLRFGLGVVLDKLERNDQAAEVFDELFRLDPANDTYATWLGDALIKVGREREGVQKLKEAIVLNRNCTDAYSCLARHYTEEDRDDEALAIVERGIHADGSVDIQDLPLFIQKILVLARAARWTALEETAHQLVAAIPLEDHDARRYAASQLGGLVPLFASAERPDLLLFVGEIMLQLDPTNSEVKTLVDHMKEPGAFHKGRLQLYQDEQVPIWIKGVVACWSGDETPDDEGQFEYTMRFLLAQRPTECKAEWIETSRRHPQALNPLRAAWEEIWSPTKQASQTSGPATTSQSGCVLALLLGGAALFVARSAL